MRERNSEKKRMHFRMKIEQQKMKNSIVVELRFVFCILAVAPLHVSAYERAQRKSQTNANEKYSGTKKKQKQNRTYKKERNIEA